MTTLELIEEVRALRREIINWEKETDGCLPEEEAEINKKFIEQVEERIIFMKLAKERL